MFIIVIFDFDFIWKCYCCFVCVDGAFCNGLENVPLLFSNVTAFCLIRCCSVEHFDISVRLTVLFVYRLCFCTIGAFY